MIERQFNTTNVKNIKIKIKLLNQLNNIEKIFELYNYYNTPQYNVSLGDWEYRDEDLYVLKVSTDQIVVYFHIEYIYVHLSNFDQVIYLHQFLSYMESSQYPNTGLNVYNISFSLENKRDCDFNTVPAFNKVFNIQTRVKNPSEFIPVNLFSDFKMEFETNHKVETGATEGISKLTLLINTVNYGPNYKIFYEFTSQIRYFNSIGLIRIFDQIKGLICDLLTPFGQKLFLIDIIDTEKQQKEIEEEWK